ncbi:MAG: hypothetical protein AAB479_00875 [Patescibacteria group bacterium]
MKTLFITAYHGFIARNILNTDVLKILRANSDLRIIIFAPPSKKELFEKYYGGPNVIIEGFDLDPIIRTSKSKFWYRLAFLLENTQYVRDQRAEYFYNNKTIFGFLNYQRLKISASILSSLPYSRTLYRWFNSVFAPGNIFEPFIKKYNPYVFFSTDIFGEQDVLFNREAHKNNIPLIGMVRSWDNTTTKGVLRVIPASILSPSPKVKEELIELHDCNAEQIQVVGLPQFDTWLEGPTLSREEFFAYIGADPSKKLLLFAPAGSILSDTDWQLAQILRDAMDAGNLPDVQILVRNHPHHPADFSKFDNDPRFIFETPGVQLRSDDYKGAEIRPDEHDHLRNSVYYSEIVMYVATSLGLDATVFDKPQILISFDGWEKKPYVQSVKRYNQEDCLASLVALGGTKVVYSADEWIAAINAYLKNPKLNQDGRHRTIGRHMYKLDGKAGKRIAQIILNRLHLPFPRIGKFF